MPGEVVGIDDDKDALGRARNHSNIDHLRIPTIFEYELLDMPESLGSFEAA